MLLAALVKKICVAGNQKLTWSHRLNVQKLCRPLVESAGKRFELLRNPSDVVETAETKRRNLAKELLADLQGVTSGTDGGKDEKKRPSSCFPSRTSARIQSRSTSASG